MQVLQERGETGSRHGRATFAVLLLQASACLYWVPAIPGTYPHTVQRSYPFRPQAAILMYPAHAQCFAMPS